jgi:hypothetical protein
MSFVSAVLDLAEKTAATSMRRPSLFASDKHRASIEKDIDRTCDAAQLLERCLPHSFGI